MNIFNTIKNPLEQLTEFDVFTFLFRNNLLFDSLRLKNIKTNSYSILNIKNAHLNGTSYFPAKKVIYFKRIVKIVNFSESFNFFLNQTLIKTIFLTLVDYQKITNSNHNIDLFNELKKIKFKPHNFYYFHFLAPHFPYYLENEFEPDIDLQKVKNDVYLKYYADYRRFILNKLLMILKNKEEKIRYIIVGDHGTREFPKYIDCLSTTLITKGYKPTLFNDSITVQDVGYLILNSY